METQEHVYNVADAFNEVVDELIQQTKNGQLHWVRSDINEPSDSDTIRTYISTDPRGDTTSIYAFALREDRAWYTIIYGDKESKITRSFTKGKPVDQDVALVDAIDNSVVVNRCTKAELAGGSVEYYLQIRDDLKRRGSVNRKDLEKSIMAAVPFEYIHPEAALAFLEVVNELIRQTRTGCLQWTVIREDTYVCVDQRGKTSVLYAFTNRSVNAPYSWEYVRIEGEKRMHFVYMCNRIEDILDQNFDLEEAILNTPSFVTGKGYITDHSVEEISRIRDDLKRRMNNV